MRIAVTFDFGGTLADLDTAMLARRCGERGVSADAGALEAALPIAWARYDAGIRAGAGGHPWKLFMRTLLGEGGVDASAVDALTDWLWDQQPTRNLWRRPIPGMFELVRALHEAKLTLGVISNSEGKLAELLGELGLGDVLPIVVDSGVLGITKPDRRIFDEAAARLGVALADIVHVGDSYAADVAGAASAGARAVWFRGKHDELPRVRAAVDAPSTRAALGAFGVAI